MSSSSAPRPSSILLVILAGTAAAVLLVHLLSIVGGMIGAATLTDYARVVAPVAVLASHTLGLGGLVAGLAVALPSGAGSRKSRAAAALLVPVTVLLSSFAWSGVVPLSLPAGISIGGMAVLVLVLALLPERPEPEETWGGAGPRRRRGRTVGAVLLWGAVGASTATAVFIVVVTFSLILHDPTAWAEHAATVVGIGDLGFFGRGSTGNGRLGGYILLFPLLLAAIAWLAYWPALTLTSPRHAGMPIPQIAATGRLRFLVLGIWSGGLLVLEMLVALVWRPAGADWLPAPLLVFFIAQQLFLLPLLAMAITRGVTTSARGPQHPVGAGRYLLSAGAGLLAAVAFVLLLGSPLLVG